MLSEGVFGLTNMNPHRDGNSCAVFTSNSRRWRQFSSCETIPPSLTINTMLVGGWCTGPVSTSAHLDTAENG